MDVFVARQPIFDRHSQVHAYELLHRTVSTRNEFDPTDETEATLGVLSGSLLTIGLQSIACGKPAFINFGRKLLLDGAVALVPKESVIVEILETVDADPEVLAACRKLRDLGYTIALDDFEEHPRLQELISIANLIKVDFRKTSEADQERLVATYRPRGIAMLAEKVETREEFERALRLGYDYFQGYFFAHPVIVGRREMQPGVLASLQLLRELQSPDVDFHKLEESVARDVALTSRLFRYVNSAMYSRHSSLKSIRSALVLLGEEGVRRWITIASLRRVAGEKPPELVACALVWAHFSETVTRMAGDPSFPSAYLVGLLSLIDALLDQPIEKALDELGLAPRIREVLTGTGAEDDVLARVYRLIVAYEAADWDRVQELTHQIGLSAADISAAYAASTAWAASIVEVTAEPPRAQAAAPPARKKERRRHRRDPLSGSCKIAWGAPLGAENFGQATILDLSQFGARFRVSTRVPMGSWLMFNYPKLDISGRGSVRYCRMVKGAYEVGVEFPGGTGWESASRRFTEKLKGLNEALDRLESTDDPLSANSASP